MKCNSCQREINDGSQFCPHCGASQVQPTQVPPLPHTAASTPPPTPPVPPRPVQPQPIQPQQQPAYTHPAPPKKSNSGTIAIIVTGVIAVVLIVAGTVIWVNRDKDQAPDEPVLTETVNQRDTVVKHDTVVVEKSTPANRTTNAYHEPNHDQYQTTAGAPTKVVVTGQNVRLRLEPNLSSQTLTYTDGTNVHPRLGQVLKYLGEEGDFYYVSYKGYNVYISKQFSVAK